MPLPHLNDLDETAIKGTLQFSFAGDDFSVSPSNAGGRLMLSAHDRGRATAVATIDPAADGWEVVDVDDPRIRAVHPDWREAIRKFIRL